VPLARDTINVPAITFVPDKYMPSCSPGAAAVRVRVVEFWGMPPVSVIVGPAEAKTSPAFTNTV
jgi:hypothetical protein